MMLDYIRKTMAAENYKLVATEYKNAHTYLDVVCPNGHDWKISWSKWKIGRRCKYCSRYIHIEDVKRSIESDGYQLVTTEWDDSESKLELICPVGHKCFISWSHWRQGVRCRSCYLNSLKTKFEDVKRIINEIGYDLLTSQNEFDDAQSYIKFRCNHGHEIKMRWSIFRRTMFCPICNKERRDDKARLDFNDIKFAFESENYIVRSNRYKNAFSKIDYICPNGHEHSIRWNDWQQGVRCPYCSHNTSNGENEIGKFLELYFSDVFYRDRKIIEPYELDIVVPSKKIAIEYCGLYWHSERNGKGATYHLTKLNKCIKNGYRLITIFEDEWLFKKDIVKSRLKHIFNLNQKEPIYARECDVKEISTDMKNRFLNVNHLCGQDTSEIALGAFYENKLIAVMTFSLKPIAKWNYTKFSKNFELKRYCYDKNLSVVGVASKLFKYFLRNYDVEDVISYADRRWSIGDFYYKLGFILLGYTRPSYWYTKDGVTRFGIFNLRKCADKYDRHTSITEKELRKSAGYYRIWDCGDLKFKFDV